MQNDNTKKKRLSHDYYYYFFLMKNKSNLYKAKYHSENLKNIGLTLRVGRADLSKHIDTDQTTQLRVYTVSHSSNSLKYINK